jgi:cytochrome c peroxidase
MKPKNLKVILHGCLLSTALGFTTSSFALTDQEQLGRLLYFDEALSINQNQACASCHLPTVGFADPDQHLPVSEGSIAGKFGSRNSPSSSYAAFFPEFTLKRGTEGGQFWDGRAADLTEQAKGPFLNPVEMAMPSMAAVLLAVESSPMGYSESFLQVCGDSAFVDASNGLQAGIENAYHCLADSIAIFERTEELSPFTSKFDAVEAGQAVFTAEEEEGFDLFTGRAKCAHCHSLGGGKDKTVFTDFKFHNIGVPSNPEMLILASLPDDFKDPGLGGALNDPKENGRFKTTHLRNVELTPPYMHNGVLLTLKEVVHFYNTRDVSGEWPEPEISDNLDSKFVGDLGLTDAEEDAIVEFMKTLNDGYM